METSELIINEHYWNFFDKENLRTELFLVPNFDILNNFRLPSKIFIRNLGLLLKKNDQDKRALYGIEIKANGSSRSSRIPLVRYATMNQSIWKVANNLSDFEKCIAELNQFEKFLKSSRENENMKLPLRVLVILSSEKEYTDQGEFTTFVKTKAKESMTHIISLEFLKQLIIQETGLEINNLLTTKELIHTMELIS